MKLQLNKNKNAPSKSVSLNCGWLGGRHQDDLLSSYMQYYEANKAKNVHRKHCRDGRKAQNLEGHNNNRIFIPVSGIFKSCQSLGGGGAVLPPYFLRSCFWMQQELHQCTGNPTDLGLLPSTSKKVARKKRTDCHSISRRSKGGSSHEMFVTWTLLRNSYINYFTFLLVQESKLPFCKEKRLKVHAP